MLILDNKLLSEARMTWLKALISSSEHQEIENVISSFFNLIESTQSYGDCFNRPDQPTYLGLSLNNDDYIDIIVQAVYSSSNNNDSIKIMDIYSSPEIDNIDENIIHLNILNRIVEYSKANCNHANFKIYFRNNSQVNYFHLIYGMSEKLRLKIEKSITNVKFFGKRWFCFELIEE